MTQRTSAAPSTVTVALCLALAAAVSLGLARFACALMLPPMRVDLGGSYFTSGTMNAVNAAVHRSGMGGAAVLLAGHGAVLGVAWRQKPLAPAAGARGSASA